MIIAITTIALAMTTIVGARSTDDGNGLGAKRRLRPTSEVTSRARTAACYASKVPTRARALMALVAAAGCGRIGFDVRVDGSDAGSNAAGLNRVFTIGQPIAARPASSDLGFDEGVQACNISRPVYCVEH
jgi:hypothetical protein